MENARRGTLYKRQAAIFDYVMEKGALSPPFTISIPILLAIALFVHLITFTALVIFFYCMVRFLSFQFAGVPQDSWGYFLVGLVFFGLWWALRPRFGHFKRSGWLPRDKYPAIYAWADTITTALGAKPIDAIGFTSAFNAGFARLGIRQKRFVVFGAPLWAILSDAERTALLSHELAHDVNGDYSQTLIVQAAYNALINITTFFYAGGILSLIGLPVIFIGDLLALIMRRLMFRTTQRAEYYADALAGTLTGRRSGSTLMHKGVFSEDFRSFTASARQFKKAPSTLFSRFRTYVEAQLNDTERTARSLEVEYSTQTNYGWTHPPSYFRREFILTHVPESGTLEVPQEVIDSANAEFAVLCQKVEPYLQQYLRPVRHCSETDVYFT